MSFKFTQVDVFSATPLKGNPLAVVHGADALSDAQMHDFRALDQPERNHLPAPAHRPGRRLPRAHLHAAPRAALRRPPHARQLPRVAGGGRCVAGRRRDRAAVRRRPDPHSPQRRAARIRRAAAAAYRAAGRRAARAHRARRLSLRAEDVLGHQWVDNGPGWAAVRLRSADAVLNLKIDWPALGGIKLGVVGPHAAGHDAQFEVRALDRRRRGLRRPGHRQPEREPGAVADRKRRSARGLRGRARHLPAAGRACAHRARSGHGVGRRRQRELRARRTHAVRRARP